MSQDGRLRTIKNKLIKLLRVNISRSSKHSGRWSLERKGMFGNRRCLQFQKWLLGDRRGGGRHHQGTRCSMRVLYPCLLGWESIILVLACINTNGMHSRPHARADSTHTRHQFYWWCPPGCFWEFLQGVGTRWLQSRARLPLSVLHTRNTRAGGI